MKRKKKNKENKNKKIPITRVIKNNFLSLPKPNGIGPSKPTTATFDSLFALTPEERRLPRKTIRKPIIMMRIPIEISLY